MRQLDNKYPFNAFFSRRIIYHPTFWILHFLFLLILLISKQTPFIITFQTAAEIEAVLILSTYAHFYLIEKLLFEKKILLYLFLSVILIYAGSLLYYQIPFNNSDNFFFSALGYISAVFVISSFKLIKKAILDHFILQEMAKKQIETELNSLKAQVNPHFLFNTLNSLYSLSLKNSPETPGMILKLSEMMKYILTKSSKDKIELNKELEFISNYIAIFKLRFSDKCDIVYDIDGDTDGIFIAPLILFPFIENSFKHGMGSSTSNSFIHLNIKIDNNILRFSVVNSIPDRVNSAADTSLKTGLENVEKRLDIIYSSKYELNIKEEDKSYKVKLVIEL